jgi:dienelactone hydrolase
VAIMGGSYGGYAALAGVTFTPDEYAASVAIVPPSNLQSLLDGIPPYWEAIRETFYKRMGDPRTPEGLAQMKRQSPLTYADRIKTPLLVVQGANDPRVKQRESDQIVVALRDRNYPVEYLLAPDEGHGFARPVNQMAMVATAEKFLAKHIGGRYQEAMTPEVTKRLAVITVDPKTVTLPGTSTTATAGGGLAGKWTWIVEAPGQPVELDVELKQEGSSFSGTSSSAIGNSVIASGKLEGKNFTATLKGDVQGQPMEFAIQGTMDGDKLTGTVTNSSFGALPFTATRPK